MADGEVACRRQLHASKYIIQKFRYALDVVMVLTLTVFWLQQILAIGQQNGAVECTEQINALAASATPVVLENDTAET